MLSHIFLLFLLIISGHVYAFENNDISINQKIDRNKIACPSLEFSEFIKVFSENLDVQIRFTKYPLKYRQIVDATADPFPKFSINFLNKNKLKFPIFLNKKNLIKYGLKINNTRINDDNYISTEVSRGEKSLGNYVEYKFKRTKNCWKLIEIIDQST
jgi:hypothetical protein